MLGEQKLIEMGNFVVCNIKSVKGDPAIVAVWATKRHKRHRDPCLRSGETCARQHEPEGCKDK